jgi:hypothetical protein
VSEEHLPVADFLWFRKTGFRHEVENSVLGIVFQALIGVKHAAQDAMRALFWSFEIEHVKFAASSKDAPDRAHGLPRADFRVCNNAAPAREYLQVAWSDCDLLAAADHKRIMTSQPAES